jgi:hypothetical protein
MDMNMRYGIRLLCFERYPKIKIILLLLLYVRKTYFIPLREDNNLQVYEKKLHRKIFGSRRMKQPKGAI